MKKLSDEVSAPAGHARVSEELPLYSTSRWSPLSGRPAFPLIFRFSRLCPDPEGSDTYTYTYTYPKCRERFVILVLLMSQFLACGCCWYNCGLDLGVYCAACCCSFWLIEPASMVEFDPESVHCFEFSQGLGCNLLCLGFEFCASWRIVSWSRKLDSMLKSSQNSQEEKGSDDGVGSNKAGIISQEWQTGISHSQEISCSVCL